MRNEAATFLTALVTIMLCSPQDVAAQVNRTPDPIRVPIEGKKFPDPPPRRISDLIRDKFPDETAPCWQRAPSNDLACFQAVPPMSQGDRVIALDPSNGRDSSTKGDKCGNPVIMRTGNKIEVEVDFRASGEFPLEFVRYFNGHSGTQYKSQLGGLWWTKIDLAFFAVSTYLDEEPWYLERFWLRRDDGSTIQLTTVSPGLWSLPGLPIHVSKVEQLASGDIVYWVEDGSKEVYRGGLIQQIINPNGISWTFYRDAQTGRMSRIQHSNGQSIQFAYRQSPHHPSTVDLDVIDPAGNLYRYTQDWYGNLQRVDFPPTPTSLQTNATQSHHFTYEYQTFLHPNLLKKNVNGLNYSSFTYDGPTDHGWLVRSSEHAGGVERIEYRYALPRFSWILGGTMPGLYSFPNEGIVYEFNDAGDQVSVSGTGRNQLPCIAAHATSKRYR